MKEIKPEKHALIPHIWTILFATFTIFIFAPLEMYITKTKYVWYSIYDFGPYIILLFVISTISLLIIDSLISFLLINKTKPYGMYELVTYVASLLLLSLYIQGNFVQFHYGLLDGTSIDWSRYRMQGFISFVTFVGVIIVGILLYRRIGNKKAGKMSGYVAICILLVEIVTLFVAGAKVNLMDKKISRVALTDDEFTYSSNENFIIIILDKFDHRLLNDLLAGDEGDYIRKTFENFTYYPDTVSLYQRTDYSFPQIVADSRYLCEEPYFDYLEHAFDDSYLINRLHELDYSVDIYTPQPLPVGYDKVDNWQQVVYSPTSGKVLLVFIYKLVAFRYMPQFLKEPFWFYPDEVDGIKTVYPVDDSGRVVMSDDELIQVYDWYNSDFNTEAVNGGFAVKDIFGSFHLYHLKGMHPILNWDRKFHSVDYNVSNEETALSLIDMLSNYFNALKKAGIYDNANIIVMSDHGDGVYKEGDLNHLPIFLCKYSGENHTMIIDNYQYSFEELNRIYAKILKDKYYDTTVLNAEELRYIYDIEWSDQQTYTNCNISAFKRIYVDGNCDNPDNYAYSGEEYRVK